jgi:hypothetical protein
MMRLERFASRWVRVLCLLATAFPATATHAQECKDGTAVNGFRVRSVKAEAFWSRTPQALNQQLAGHQGEAYSSDAGIQYVNEVRNYLDTHLSATTSSTPGVNNLSKLSASVRYTYPCPVLVSEPDCEAQFNHDPAAPVKKCVDVVVKTKALYLDVIDVGSNLLPVPRTNRLIFLNELPAPLVALKPTLTVGQDKRAGTSVRFGISTDLLDPFGAKAAKKAADDGVQKTQLRFDLRGEKSIDKPFYDSDAGLSLIHARPSKLIDSLRLDAGFAAREQPRGDGIVLKNLWMIGGSFALTPRQGAVSRVSFGGRYRRSSNRFFSGDGRITELTSEDAVEGRLIADGHIANGFTRLALWVDGDSPKRFNESYQRLGVMAGYYKEIPVALNQTIGVELIAGGARSWGFVPEYARFYGGSSTGNFLYDGLESPSLTAFPSGPLLRSFGRQQAGGRTPTGTLRGGTSYWHANLNISIPLGCSCYSRPLIPNEDVGPGTLKNIIKIQVSREKNLYIADTARKKLTPEQQKALSLNEDKPLTPEQREQLRKAREAYDAAKREVAPEADKIWKEITPIVKFIADQANLYSIKPLIMFDIAEIKAGENINNRTRYALGGGLQLTVVVAKFELGYMQTLNRISGDSRGNVVARLVFQNIF